MTRTAGGRKPIVRIPEGIREAIRAALSKKATDVIVLDLRKSAAFTDYFIICSGNTARQSQAIVDAVRERLSDLHVRPSHVEGYDRADWVLLDFFDFIVHVFTPETRAFYALERLWGSAERIEIPEQSGAGL